MDNLIDFPTAIPAAAWAMLANALRGQVPDKVQAVKVGWNVVGYIARVSVGDTTPPVMSGELDNEKAACICEQMACCDDPTKPAMKAIPWLLLLPLIETLLKKLLAGETK